MRARACSARVDSDRHDPCALESNRSGANKERHGPGLGFIASSRLLPLLEVPRALVVSAPAPSSVVVPATPSAVIETPPFSVIVPASSSSVVVPSAAATPPAVVESSASAVAAAVAASVAAVAKVGREVRHVDAWFVSLNLWKSKDVGRYAGGGCQGK